MRFIAKPPIFEARDFDGSELSAVDIRGWLLANGVEAIDYVVNDGEVPNELHFTNPSDQGFVKLKAGDWLIQMAENDFQIITTNKLFSNYQVTTA